VRLSPEKKCLIEKAYKNDNILDITTAFRVYSSEKSAKKAVKSLEENGVIERTSYGKFKLVELPEDLEYLEEEKFNPKDYIGIILKKVADRIRKESKKEV